jgi:geranylgeranyl diphosphate synthase type II
LGIEEYLDTHRQLVIDRIADFLPSDRAFRPILYDLMLEYPLREAKGLRPALCIATCCALGGQLEAVLPSAAVLELFHNAFLIHDDIEDQSESRRGAPTLHRDHGTGVAINVGDAMFALALSPLLENVRFIGLGPALRVLETVARMCRETVEGQALELDWIRTSRWDLEDDDYFGMVEKKTGWYTFIGPVSTALPASGQRVDLRKLRAPSRIRGTGIQNGGTRTKNPW